MFGKKAWNKGNITVDKKEYNKNYMRELRQKQKKNLVHLMGNECSRCKSKNLPLCCWDWHHEDPEEKAIAISQLLSGSWTRILEEIIKCIMVCANCHRIIHHGEESLDAT